MTRIQSDIENLCALHHIDRFIVHVHVDCRNWEIDN